MANFKEHQTLFTGPRCPSCGLPTQPQAYSGGREGYCRPCDNNFLINPPITVTVEAALVDNAAVRGQWVAVMLDCGNLPTHNAAVASVIRVATVGNEYQLPAYPGSDLPDGVLYEISRFGDEYEARLRWAQAQAVAELLNAVQADGGR